MDSYEILLTEKLKHAEYKLRCMTKEYEEILPFTPIERLERETGDFLKNKRELVGEINAYQEALISYRNLKIKGEI